MKYLMLLLIMVRNMSAGQLQQVIGAGVSATSDKVNKHNKYGIKLMVLVHKWGDVTF
jgi:hypothetical protein